MITPPMEAERQRAQAIEVRLTAIETRLDTFATKADLANLRADMKGDIARLETRLIKWMVGVLIASIAVASSIAVVAERLFGN